MGTPSAMTFRTNDPELLAQYRTVMTAKHQATSQATDETNKKALDNALKAEINQLPPPTRRGRPSVAFCIFSEAGREEPEPYILQL